MHWRRDAMTPAESRGRSRQPPGARAGAARPGCARLPSAGSPEPAAGSARQARPGPAGVPVAWAGATSPQPSGDASAAACQVRRSSMPGASSEGPGRARQAQPGHSTTSAAPESPGAAPLPRAGARVSPHPWTRRTAPATRARKPPSPAAGKPASRTRALIMATTKYQVIPEAKFSTSTAWKSRHCRLFQAGRMAGFPMASPSVERCPSGNRPSHRRPRSPRHEPVTKPE